MLLQVYVRALLHLKNHSRKVLAIIAANVALAGAAVLEPMLFGHIVDQMSARKIPVAALSAWFVFTVTAAFLNVHLARIADRLAHRCRTELLAKSVEDFIGMPPHWHSRIGTPKIAQLLFRATDALFNIWLTFMRGHLATFLALLLLLPTALYASRVLGSVLILLGLSYWCIGRVVIARTQDKQVALERYYNDVHSNVMDALGNVSLLHAYNRIADEAGLIGRSIQNLLEAQFPVLTWWSIAYVLNRLAATIAMGAILVFGAFSVKNGTISAGTIVTFASFATILIGRLDEIRGFVSQLSEAHAKISEFWTLSEHVETEQTGRIEPALPRISGRVEFRDVSFRFDDGDAGLRHISFVAEPGQTVAIVGPTGSGKTTLANLLLRFLDPDSGMILLDDIDIQTVSRQSVRDQIAVVSQDCGLLNRSIRANIALGRDDASEDDIVAAAMAASAHDFIMRRPLGYDDCVGEKGGRLSGGERQRICIARALLKAAPILILDEATSALDAQTEAEVKEMLEQYRADHTRIIIAHRLSTVRDADIVIVLEAGRIVEIGSYQSLLAARGHFSRLLEVSGMAA